MNESYTILYVDDDMDDLLLVTEAFEKYTDHLRVIHAHNGLDGWTKLRSMKTKGSLPCLLILDINMPVMNGKELLKNIREDESFHHLPVVVFSTSSNVNDKTFAESLDAEYVTKPLDFSDLKSLVAGFVTKCKYELAGKAPSLRN